MSVSLGVERSTPSRGVVLDMQSFVGKLTHACPVYYCSRSARPRALPAGLSVVAADWPHVSNSGCDGSSGIQHHHLGLGVDFEFRHEVPPRRLRRASRHPRVAGQVRREDREHVLRPSTQPRTVPETECSRWVEGSYYLDIMYYEVNTAGTFPYFV